MARKFNSLLAGSTLALALVSAPAFADGMAQGGAAPNGGWYAGLFAGAAWPEDWDLNEVDRIEMDTGFAFGGVLGKQVQDNVRVELEVSNWNADGDCTIGKCGILALDMDTLSVLGNAWVDIPVESTLTPYVGAGLGVSWVELSGDGLSDTGTGFTWQLGAGVRADLSPTVTVDIGYRYKSAAMDSDDFNGFGGLSSRDFDARAHVLQAGLNYRF
jgi:opacity protein-like surface antigen